MPNSGPSFSESNHQTCPPTSMLQTAAEDEDMDEDDLFARMQSKMSSLIEEGTRALHSQVELEDEEPQRPTLTPSRSDPLGWNRTAADIPPSSSFGNRSISSRFEMGMTPSQSYMQSPVKQPFVFGTNTSESSSAFLASPRSSQLTTQGRSQNSPYSRIPRLGAPSTPQTPTAKRRFK